MIRTKWLWHIQSKRSKLANVEPFSRQPTQVKEQQQLQKNYKTQKNTHLISYI